MKRAYIVAITIILTVGCSDGIIPRDKLVKIVAEFYVTDGLANKQPELLQKMDSLYIYDPILRKYGYSKEEFKKTIEHYMSRPTKLLKIYEEAKLLLENQLAELKIRLDLENYKIIADNPSTALYDLKDRIEKLKELDSRERVFRWLIFHHIQPKWRLYEADSLSSKFERPETRIWWENNFKLKQRHFNEYTHDSFSLPDTSTEETDIQGIPEDRPAGEDYGGGISYKGD